ncbi:MAG: xylulose kinase [Microbacterium sp.]|nr:MAG: xylulose kinase [Microbacterium sp.]
MVRTLVAGIDSSTQQTKLVVVDAATGTLVRSSALPHPDGTEIDPEHWWAALRGVGGTRLADVSAVSVAAQQHTTIFLDEEGASVRDAILWNDARATSAAEALRGELGDDAWLAGPGLLPDAAHPVSKLRWLADHEPDVAARVHRVLLPHDWLTWRLLGCRREPVTDRSDASATGYWSAGAGAYAPDLARRALGHDLRLPDVRAVDDVVGVTSNGVMVGVGAGDNAATHLALDTKPGDVVVSIGTSATVSMRCDAPAHDPGSLIDTMADTRGGFIPIVAMLNGARVLSATARMLGVTLEKLDALATEGEPGADGIMLVPFLDGERNPRAGHATGALTGLSRHAMTPANIARASVLGVACSVVQAIDALTAHLGEPGRILLVGGGARSSAMRQAITDVAGRETEWPEHREHAAFGAARQAAWALIGGAPDWGPLAMAKHVPAAERAWVDEVRARYRDAAGRV